MIAFDNMLSHKEKVQNNRQFNDEQPILDTEFPNLTFYHHEFNYSFTLASCLLFIYLLVAKNIGRANGLQESLLWGFIYVKSSLISVVHLVVRWILDILSQSCLDMAYS